MRLILLALLGVGCAVPAVNRTGQSWIPNVPNLHQRYGCAPTAAANALVYEGYHRRLGITADSLQHLLAWVMSTKPNGATEAEAIPHAMAVVTRTGPYRLVWDDSRGLLARNELVRQIEAGHPVVVLLYGGKHAATCVGYGPPDETIIRTHDGGSVNSVNLRYVDWPLGVVVRELN